MNRARIVLCLLLILIALGGDYLPLFQSIEGSPLTETTQNSYGSLGFATDQRYNIETAAGRSRYCKETRSEQDD